MGDSRGEERVASQRARLVEFAGVHVWLAGVAGGVDNELRFLLAEKFQQHVEARVVNVLARERGEVAAALLEFVGKSLADVTGGAEK